MPFRLHSRLVALNVVAISVATLLVGYFLGSSLRTTFETDIEGQLYRSAVLARNYIDLHPAGWDPVDLANDISKSLDVRVTIIAANGIVLGDSDVTRLEIPTLPNHSDRPEVIQAHQNGRGSATRLSSTIGVPFIYVAITMQEGRILRVAKPLATVEQLMAGLRRQLALATLFSLGMTLILGYMVYALVSRPLRRMAEASRKLARGNLDFEIPVVGDSNLALVGSSLNAMAKSLQRKMGELQEDKQRIEAIVAAMSAGIVVVDPEARIVLANQSIRRLLEIHGDPEGKMPMELVRQASFGAAVRSALEGVDVPAVDLTTGSGRVLSAKAAPVRASSGRVEMAVVVFHDLTEIRRTEKMRKDFVANVSHEFKTPLTSIRGYAETLLNAAPQDPQLTREFLEIIERNSALLQSLVDDLLVLARLERELPIEKQQLNIRDLVEKEIHSRDHSLGEKGIRVELECPSVEIFADSQRLRRAISNLLDNAIHYNHPGGEVRITGKVLATGFSLDITDSGVGIPREDLIRVFERFYRVEKSRTRESGGTGLGLAIARHAVESQGGTITVTSRLGIGSTFSLFLPNA